MFKEQLRAIVDRSDGGIAASSWTRAASPLESYSKDDAPFDITVVGIEYGVVVDSIKRAAESLEAGAARRSRSAPTR